MSRLLQATAIAAAALCATAATAAPAPADSLDRAVAVFVASNMKIAVDNALAQLTATGVDVDTTAVKALIVEEFARPYDRAAHDAANAAIERVMDAKAREASTLMLAKASAEEGARTLPDGLIIKTLSEGDTGHATPTDNSDVAIRYRGLLPDGSVFDAIGPDEQPMISRVSELTPGMREGLTLMHPGGRYRLTMPASLGYGEEGVPGVIPPGCALTFEVELVKIL